MKLDKFYLKQVQMIDKWILDDFKKSGVIKKDVYNKLRKMEDRLYEYSTKKN